MRDKEVCERWCVTKMVCDKVVCVCDNLSVIKLCVTKLCVCDNLCVCVTRLCVTKLYVRMCM